MGVSGGSGGEWREARAAPGDSLAPCARRQGPLDPSGGGLQRPGETRVHTRGAATVPRAPRWHTGATLVAKGRTEGPGASPSRSPAAHTGNGCGRGRDPARPPPADPAAAAHPREDPAERRRAGRDRGSNSGLPSARRAGALFPVRGRPGSALGGRGLLEGRGLLPAQGSPGAGAQRGARAPPRTHTHMSPGHAGCTRSRTRVRTHRPGPRWMHTRSAGPGRGLSPGERRAGPGRPPQRGASRPRFLPSPSSAPAGPQVQQPWTLTRQGGSKAQTDENSASPTSNASSHSNIWDSIDVPGHVPALPSHVQTGLLRPGTLGLPANPSSSTLKTSPESDLFLLPPLLPPGSASLPGALQKAPKLVALPLLPACHPPPTLHSILTPAPSQTVTPKRLRPPGGKHSVPGSEVGQQLAPAHPTPRCYWTRVSVPDAPCARAWPPRWELSLDGTARASGSQPAPEPTPGRWGPTRELKLQDPRQGPSSRRAALPEHRCPDAIIKNFRTPPKPKPNRLRANTTAARPPAPSLLWRTLCPFAAGTPAGPDGTLHTCVGSGGYPGVLAGAGRETGAPPIERQPGVSVSSGASGPLGLWGLCAGPAPPSWPPGPGQGDTHLPVPGGGGLGRTPRACGRDLPKAGAACRGTEGWGTSSSLSGPELPGGGVPHVPDEEAGTTQARWELGRPPGQDPSPTTDSGGEGRERPPARSCRAQHRRYLPVSRGSQGLREPVSLFLRPLAPDGRRRTCQRPSLSRWCPEPAPPPPWFLAAATNGRSIHSSAIPAGQCVGQPGDTAANRAATPLELERLSVRSSPGQLGWAACRTKSSVLPMAFGLF
ncbi:collagen alpha-1(III) chain-like [Choloepus didactylus]|uniref:collagen alpha-1(III) chain-like n=1 Tax=Choloepus didactylus TaxID=27675 RepID=UPI00189F7E6F|nr:collagen alpha-1(III) chain-like [Choloepus didactylus]